MDIGTLGELEVINLLGKKFKIRKNQKAEGAHMLLLSALNILYLFGLILLIMYLKATSGLLASPHEYMSRVA